MQKVIDPGVEKKLDWEIHWHNCKKYIADALKYQDLYHIEDVEERIKNGTFLLWPGEKSAYVTEFVFFPRVKAINLLFCGGDYQELEKMLPYIEDFAKKYGCTRFYGGGRKGWIKLLTKRSSYMGWQSVYNIRKDFK